MKITTLAMTLVAFAAGGKGVLAHEFWIDPVDFMVAGDQAVVANLRVGEAYRGAPMPYLPQGFARFEVMAQGMVHPVEGRLGDIPALAMGGLAEGLAIILHETAGQSLTWSEWARFVAFADHKDLGDVAMMQAARGLDQEEVAEVYIRYAKSLVAMGDGAGADARFGLRTEFVALANPYVDDLSSGFGVQLWLGDAPRANVQVEMFAKAPDGAVEVTLHCTDGQGIVRLPVAPGHRYMIDAVVLEPMTPQAAGDAEWRTLWANMTFGVPR